MTQHRRRATDQTRESTASIEVSAEIASLRAQLANADEAREALKAQVLQLARALDGLSDAEQQHDPTDPTEVPGFWVINDEDEGSSIWRWDGASLRHYLHEMDIAFHAGPLDDPAARGRLWALVTKDIPVAPHCVVCDDAAITHLTRCPTHLPEETS